MCNTVWYMQHFHNIWKYLKELNLLAYYSQIWSSPLFVVWVLFSSFSNFSGKMAVDEKKIDHLKDFLIKSIRLFKKIALLWKREMSNIFDFPCWIRKLISSWVITKSISYGYSNQVLVTLENFITVYTYSDISLSFYFIIILIYHKHYHVSLCQWLHIVD